MRTLLAAVFTAIAVSAPVSAQQFRDCPTCPEMVQVPAGSFEMGSDRTEDMRGGEVRPEGPVRQVTIKKPFALGKFEITNAEWKRFMDAAHYRSSQVCNTWTGKEGEAVMNWKNPGHSAPIRDDDPVVCVSWYDAKAYVAWLSGVTGKPYRLPTEAEWEYAAKAGSTTTWPWGEDEKEACKYENTYDLDARDQIPKERAVSWAPVECRDGYAEPSPVGKFLPNKFGLYDMLGNVWEWAEDCSLKLYPAQPNDGSAHQIDKPCELRAVRGGSWQTRQSRHRPTFRGRDPEHRASHIFGFRVARDVE